MTAGRVPAKAMLLVTISFYVRSPWVISAFYMSSEVLLLKLRVKCSGQETKSGVTSLLARRLRARITDEGLRLDEPLQWYC